MTTKRWFFKRCARSSDTGLRVFTAVVTLLGVVLLAASWWTGRHRILSGMNDFVVFYGSPRLVGSPDLYNPARTRQVQLEATRASGEAFQNTRLPHFYALLWPLGQLPYQVAYAVWQSLSLAAVIGFICLWPEPNRRAVLLACCWSVPLSANFANGQDCAFLLLWIVLGLRWHRQRPFLAGIVLSLCAAKFHLFALLPLLIALQRRWRMLNGLVAGSALILLACFWSAGPRWFLDYYVVLSSPKVGPGEDIMPNLHGLLLNTPHALALEFLLAVSVAVAAGMVVHRLTFEQGMAATLAGGLLISYHAYPADAVLLIPALCIVMSRVPWIWLRGLAFGLLLPVWYFFLMAGGRQGDPLRLGILLMVYAMALQAWQAGTSAAWAGADGERAHALP